MHKLQIMKKNRVDVSKDSAQNWPVSSLHQGRIKHSSMRFDCENAVDWLLNWCDIVQKKMLDYIQTSHLLRPWTLHSLSCVNESGVRIRMRIKVKRQNYYSGDRKNAVTKFNLWKKWLEIILFMRTYQTLTHVTIILHDVKEKTSCTDRAALAQDQLRTHRYLVIYSLWEKKSRMKADNGQFAEKVTNTISDRLYP